MTLPTQCCAHIPCRCEVPSDQSYCSDHCSLQAALEQEHLHCECEHATCALASRALSDERS